MVTTIRLISRVLPTGLFIIMAAAAAGASQRQYAPDCKVDILHITIDVTPDFEAKEDPNDCKESTLKHGTE